MKPRRRVTVFIIIRITYLHDIDIIFMTVQLQTLKSVKNNVIGNPSAKLAIAQDQGFVAR